METLTMKFEVMTMKEAGEKTVHVDDEIRNRLGSLISADGDNYVYYSKYGDTFVVTKGLYTGYSDSEDLYLNEIYFQERLAEDGLAPRILAKDILRNRKGREFKEWISEDAGLPVEIADIAAVNAYLDVLYDKGVILYPYTIHHSLFVKGFDGKIRATDFKQTEDCGEPLGKHNRRYLAPW
jgi:hypothetical protein